MADPTEILSNNTASVVEQSLLAFGAGMSYQSRTDVKNAYHFASLVANKQFNQEDESEAWFNQFLKVMQDCGWVTARRSFERVTSESQSLNLGGLAFKAISSVGSLFLGGPLGVAVNTLAGNALSKLGSVQEAQEVFKRNVKEKGSGTVGLAACIETSEGEVVLGMSAINTSGADKNLEAVVFDWKSNASEHYTGSAALSFNKVIYEGVRAAIEAKLGERSKAAVLDYDI